MPRPLLGGGALMMFAKTWSFPALATMLTLCAAAAPALSSEPGTPPRCEVIRAFEEGRFSEARRLALAWIEEHPGDGAMIYNVACAEARLGTLDEAERRLLESVKAGFMNFSVMRRDPDLDPLRSRAALRAILSARDAADPIVSERRIRRARQRFPGASMTLDRDEKRNFDYLTALNAEDREALQRIVAGLTDYLAWQLFEQPPRHRVLIVVPDRESFERAVPSANIHGVYRHEPGELLCDGSSRALRHEVVHALHHAHMDRLGQEHPIWIQEGLACLFESSAPDSSGDAKVYANERHQIAITLLESDRLLPLAGLARQNRPEFNRYAAAAYAQARSIFEFLDDRDLLAEWYAEYTLSYHHDPTGLAALEVTFGAEIAAVERQWRDWLRARAPAYMIDDTIVRVTAHDSRSEPQDSRAPCRQIETRPADNAQLALSADDADALFREAHPVLLRDYATAAPTLKRITEMNPNHAAARYDLALASILKGDLEAARRERDALRDLDTNLANLVDSALMTTGR